MKINQLRIGVIVLVLSLSALAQVQAEDTPPDMDKLLNAAQSLMQEQKPSDQKTTTDESLLNSAAALMQAPDPQGQPLAVPTPAKTEPVAPEQKPPTEPSAPPTNPDNLPSVVPPPETTPEPQPAAPQASQPEAAPNNEVQPDTTRSDPPEAVIPPEPTLPPETAASSEPINAAESTTDAPRSYGVMVKQKNAEGQEVTYFKVEEGASLSAIAGQIYQDPMKFRLIYEANKEQLTSPDRVAAGALLIIPPLE